MRILILLAVALFALSGLGYFAILNSDTIFLYLSPSLSLNIPLWAVMLVFSVLGFLASELRSLVLHPDRFFQRFRVSLEKARQQRRIETYRDFHRAVLSCDLRRVKRLFARITPRRAPLDIRVKNLVSKRYIWDTPRMLQGFFQLRQEFPNELEVLLPYQQFTLEVGEWGIAEQLSHEIDRLAHNHPEALMGLREVFVQRGDWPACVRQERHILELYPDGVIGDQVRSRHEQRLHLAAEQEPELLNNWSMKYLPGGKKAIKHLYSVSAAISEANHLHQNGQSIKAAELLRTSFEQNGTPRLLDELERLYTDTGNNQTIYDMLERLENSSKTSLYVTLTLARINLRSGNTEEAQRRLQQMQPESSNAAASLYHALRYQLALKLKKPEAALEAASQLTPANHTN